MSKAVEFHKKGFNCAESIIKTFNEEKNANIPVSIASPFGSGMSVGATCGAISGALMALGFVKGRETSDTQNESRKNARVFMTKLKEKYGTFECVELKRKGVSCDEIIAYAYDILTESI